MKASARGKAPLSTGSLILDLSNPNGTLYDVVTQASTIAISVGGATPGGWALVPIVANGSPITIPGNWIHYGGDILSTTLNNVNHLQVFYKDANAVYYTNKIV